MNRKTILSTLTTVALFVTLFVASVQRVEAKPKRTQVYMFGYSLSFVDSVAFMTDIIYMDSVYIETKTGFLYDRSIYSQQLQYFVEQFYNQPNTTCAIFFNRNKSALQRKYQNIKDLYKAKNEVTITDISEGTFRFTCEEWTDRDDAKLKAAKKARKEAKKNKESLDKKDGMQGPPPGGGKGPGSGRPGGGMGPGGMSGGMGF